LRTEATAQLPSEVEFVNKSNNIFCDYYIKSEQNFNEYMNIKNGCVIEQSQGVVAIVKLIADHIKKYGGAGLFIDYGYNINPKLRDSTSYVSTLQAMRNHQYIKYFFENIGSFDLTFHVDFYQIIKILKEAEINMIDYHTQKDFLVKYGINQRFDSLCKISDDKTKKILQNQYDRLVLDMGELFKIVSFEF
jgi:SAM-dependent MidA family methyltransferase